MHDLPGLGYENKPALGRHAYNLIQAQTPNLQSHTRNVVTKPALVNRAGQPPRESPQEQPQGHPQEQPHEQPLQQRHKSSRTTQQHVSRVSSRRSNRDSGRSASTQSTLHGRVKKQRKRAFLQKVFEKCVGFFGERLVRLIDKRPARPARGVPGSYCVCPKVDHALDWSTQGPCEEV